MKLSIHPSVGLARLGNSLDQICLSPDSIGGLPYEADAHGNSMGPIREFKDERGLVKRQGQLFKIFQEGGEELTLDSPNVAAIRWSVHLANKKAAWYQYSELEGNLLFGEDNSYTSRGVALRNAKVEGEATRQSLIVDPGPRSISGRQQSIAFDRENVPAGYPAQFPPDTVQYGTPIRTLGNLLTDDAGRLVVLGGFGNAGGDEPLTSYGGSDTWHDDISDGSVHCTVSFSDGSPDIHLQAWCIVGSPDFAPEIVNISNLSDTMFDVAVRYFGLVPDLYADGRFNQSFVVNYQRDILPIINRISRYQWVANVQSMMAFTSNVFDFSDPSEGNRANREAYCAYFRRPNAIPPVLPPAEQPQQRLFLQNGENMFPMMPLNSGSNSVSNINVVKFLSLDETQQFLLEQWARGTFVSNPVFEPYPVHHLDAASVGNAVGLPMCPGIEVTWNLQNRNVYAAPYQIAEEQGEGGYAATGLTPSRDECEGGGCQPGDLTKRMACPWQADFFQCTIQPINFTDPSINKANGTPVPPTYYSYWWPPQSPWDVLVGEFEAAEQAINHTSAGQQMNYARGINSFVQMVEYWFSLGFIRDMNAGNKGFPYFVERERDNELFTYRDVPVSDISGNPADAETTIPVFFVQQNPEEVKKLGPRATRLMTHLETRAFKKIEVHERGLPLPRSGTRNRR